MKGFWKKREPTCSRRLSCHSGLSSCSSLIVRSQAATPPEAGERRRGLYFEPYSSEASVVSDCRPSRVVRWCSGVRLAGQTKGEGAEKVDRRRCLGPRGAGRLLVLVLVLLVRVLVVLVVLVLVLVLVW